MVFFFFFLIKNLKKKKQKKQKQGHTDREGLNRTELLYFKAMLPSFSSVINLSFRTIGSKRRSEGSRMESGGTKRTRSFFHSFATGSGLGLSTHVWLCSGCSLVWLYHWGQAAPMNVPHFWNTRVAVHTHLCTQAGLTSYPSFHRNRSLVASSRGGIVHMGLQWDGKTHFHIWAICYLQLIPEGGKLRHRLWLLSSSQALI